MKDNRMVEKLQTASESGVGCTDLLADLYVVPMNTGIAIRANGHECVARLKFDDRCQDADRRREIVRWLTELSNRNREMEKALRLAADVAAYQVFVNR